MKSFYFAVLCAALIMAVAGCQGISAPYVMKMDRIDQNVKEGNRGYLKGTPPPADDRSGLVRELIAVDVDLPEVNAKENIK